MEDDEVGERFRKVSQDEAEPTVDQMTVARSRVAGILSTWPAQKRGRSRRLPTPAPERAPRDAAAGLSCPGAGAN